jgi:hypothetical protein
MATDFNTRDATSSVIASTADAALFARRGFGDCGKGAP